MLLTTLKEIFQSIFGLIFHSCYLFYPPQIIPHKGLFKNNAGAKVLIVFCLRVETRCWYFGHLPRTEPDASVEQNRSFYPLSTSFDDNIICLRISSLIPHNLLLKSLLWEKNSKQSNFLPIPNWEGTMTNRVWTDANRIQCKYSQPATTFYPSIYKDCF